MWKSLFAIAGLLVCWPTYANAQVISYRCKAFENPPSGHEDIKIQFDVLKCSQEKCQIVASIFFKGKNLFDGELSINRSYLSSPGNSTSVVYDHRDPNSDYLVFNLQHEVFQNKREDFIYGFILDTSDEYNDLVNFKCIIN